MFKKCMLICSILLFMTLLLQAQAVKQTRAIETFPFTETFENVTTPGIPDGWTVEDTNQDYITWGSRYVNGYSAPISMACDYSDYVDMDDWFFTPPLLLNNGVSYRVTFSYKCEYADFPERLEVKYGNAPVSDSMGITPIFSNTNIQNESFQQVITLFLTASSSEPSSIYYVGWHGFSLVYEWTLWVDDITIEEVPSVPLCDIFPSAYNFGQCSLGLNSQEIGFIVTNTGSGVILFDGCYLLGENMEDFRLLDTNSYPYVLMETEQMLVSISFFPKSIGTKSVILRFIEDGTIYHDVLITGTSIDNTVCCYPFIQDFETADLPPKWVKISDGAGWRFGTILGRGTFPIPLHTTYAAVNKNTSIFEYDQLPGRNDLLIPPPFNLTAGVGIPHLTFTSYYTMLSGEHATVEYSTDGANWNTLFEVPAYSGGWRFYDINLDEYNAYSRFFIRFHADDMGIASATGWAIDDVNLLFVNPIPPAPVHVRTQRSGTNILLTWDAVPYVDGYRVYSSPDPNLIENDLWTLETATPITDTHWTGTTNLPTKYFRIKAIRNQ